MVGTLAKNKYLNFESVYGDRNMSSEIFWLTLTAVNTALLVFIYAPPRIGRVGLVQVLINPLPGDDPFPPGQEWAQRAVRAHINSIENLVVFAPLALSVYVTGAGNEVTATACAVYFWARLVHGPFTVIKPPFVRTIAYFVGLCACLVLAYELLLIIPGTALKARKYPAKRVTG